MPKLTKRTVDAIRNLTRPGLFMWDDEMKGLWCASEADPGPAPSLCGIETPEGAHPADGARQDWGLDPGRRRKLAREKLAAVAGGRTPARNGTRRAHGVDRGRTVRPVP